MSTRRLRARLDRLTQSANRTRTKGKRERPFEFTIDPALAKAIWDGQQRLYHLRYPDGLFGEKVPEPEEARALRLLIAEKAKTINCPAYYGFRERWDDSARRSRLGPDGFCDELPYPAPEVTLYDVEDVEAERALLAARIEAFDHSPEGRARARIEELQSKTHGWMSASEHAELDRLMVLYPEPWCHPNCPDKDFCIYARLHTPEQRKRAAEKDQRTFESANLHRGRAK
jgi:hypothetical protein